MLNKSSLSVVIGLAALSVFKKKSGNKNKDGYLDNELLERAVQFVESSDLDDFYIEMAIEHILEISEPEDKIKNIDSFNKILEQKKAAVAAMQQRKNKDITSVEQAFKGNLRYIGAGSNRKAYLTAQNQVLKIDKGLSEDNYSSHMGYGYSEPQRPTDIRIGYPSRQYSQGKIVFEPYIEGESLISRRSIFLDRNKSRDDVSEEFVAQIIRISNMNPSKIDEVFDTAIKMAKHKIQIDGNRDNFILTPDGDIVIIDVMDNQSSSLKRIESIETQNIRNVWSGIFAQAFSVGFMDKVPAENALRFEEMANLFAEKYGVHNTLLGSRNRNNVLLVRTQQMLEEPLDYVGDPDNITYIEFEIELPNGVPHWLPLFKNTQELVLSETGINQLPESIFTLNNLELLDISRNPIHELPDDIKKLRKLKVLDITRTNIRFLPNRMFDYLQNIYHFEALFTPLEEINSDILNSSLSRLILTDDGANTRFNFSLDDITRAVLNPDPNRDFTMTPDAVRYLINRINQGAGSQLRRF